MTSMKKLDTLRSQGEAIIGEAQQRMLDASEVHALRTSQANQIKQVSLTLVSDEFMTDAQYVSILKLLENHKYADVVAEATKVISRLQNRLKMVASGSGSASVLIHPRIVEVCHAKAQAHTQQREFEKAVVDCSTSLDMCATLLTSHPDSVPSSQLSDLRRLQGVAFKLRGALLSELGDFKGAVGDLRAHVAFVRSAGKDFNADHESYTLLLIAMARSKAGCPRPHYTPKEVHQWNKELGINEYSPFMLACSHCKARPSATVSLRCCGRCRNVWFCGTVCQKAGWPAHKGACSDNSVTKLIFSSPTRANMLECVAKEGFACVHDTRTGPTVIVQDNKGTGQLFVSLGDHDIIFSG